MHIHTALANPSLPLALPLPGKLDCEGTCLVWWGLQVTCPKGSDIRGTTHQLGDFSKLPPPRLQNGFKPQLPGAAGPRVIWWWDPALEMVGCQTGMRVRVVIDTTPLFPPYR